MIASAEIANANMASCRSLCPMAGPISEMLSTTKGFPAVCRGGVQHGIGHHPFLLAGIRPQFDEEDVFPLDSLQRRLAMAPWASKERISSMENGF